MSNLCVIALALVGQLARAPGCVTSVRRRLLPRSRPRVLSFDVLSGCVRLLPSR